MNKEISTDAAQFLFGEYKNLIFIAVCPETKVSIPRSPRFTTKNVDLHSHYKTGMCTLGYNDFDFF
jgi:hypothetical protein